MHMTNGGLIQCPGCGLRSIARDEAPTLAVEG